MYAGPVAIGVPSRSQPYANVGVPVHVPGWQLIVSPGSPLAGIDGRAVLAGPRPIASVTPVAS